MRIGDTPRWSKAHLLISAAAAVLLSACSTSVERFSQNPSDKDPVYTATVPPEEENTDVVADTGEEPVVAKPLAKARIKAKSRSQDYADNGGYAQPNYGQRDRDFAEESADAAVYKRPAKKRRIAPVEVVEADEPTVEPAAADETPAIPRHKSGGVRVEQGMTLYSIARANGLPVARVAEANGIDAPYSVHVGQVIKIPGVAKPRVPQVAMKEKVPAAEPEPVEVTEAPPAEEPEAKPIKIKQPQGKSSGRHVVKNGDTLFSLGRKYGVHPYAIASLNGLEKDSTLNLGQAVKIPAGGKAQTEVVEEVDDEAPPVKAPGKKGKAKIAEKLPESTDEVPPTEDEAAPAKAKPKKQVVADAEVEEEPEAAPPPAAANGAPGFRWPVKGKVISGYGPKTNGLRNEGINLAVPEGTSVRAAESGVIAYAGNELKGYGNLVLIRHEGGWVTAYAHAKELFVKRGDTVKRGDVIAKAGQTGSVTSPQLHFEIRKGATAMDPMRYLNSATAQN